MRKILSIVLLLSMGLSTLNAIEVNAIFYTKGKAIPTKITLTLPDNWYIKPSKSPQSAGDYLITKEKSIYMRFTLSEWKNDTVKTYASIQTRNGFTEHIINDTSIFTKEILKDRRRIDIGRFIETTKKVSLSTTLGLYDDYLNDSVAKELQEALAIMISAKIVAFPDTSKIIDPKITSTKQKVDKGLLKVQKYAEAGNARRFPSCCAFADESLIKYTFPDAPQEIVNYYKNAKQLCYGKIHTQALHEKLKKEGKSVCRNMEVTLQINHIKKYIEKTNDIPTWNSFLTEYNQICPNHSNTGY